MEFLITYGRDRCWTAMTFGRTSDAAAKVEELRRLQDEGSAVQFRHYTKEDDSPEVRRMVEQVSKNADQLRVVDGIVGARPLSSPRIIGEPAIGEWFEIECCYDREPPTEHVLVINGDRFVLGTKSKGRFRFCKSVDLVISVESEKHFARVVPLSIHEED